MIGLSQFPHHLQHQQNLKTSHKNSFRQLNYNCKGYHLVWDFFEVCWSIEEENFITLWVIFSYFLFGEYFCDTLSKLLLSVGLINFDAELVLCSHFDGPAFNQNGDHQMSRQWIRKFVIRTKKNFFEASGQPNFWTTSLIGCQYGKRQNSECKFFAFVALIWPLIGK